jgi:vacuolar-type H+-ATPase subunit E/Vma4
VLIKTVNGCYRLQKVLKDEENVKKTLDKIKNWLNGFEGDNDEGAFSYLQEKLKEAIK